LRYLILSDIHANFVAMNAVLEDAGSFDRIWCMGDLVGYGPEPNACIERLQEFEHVCVAGNHDWAVIGRLDLGHFNVDARLANAWTREVLQEENREYLESLPNLLQQNEDYTLAHGSPREPIWEYVLDVERAAINFRYFDTPFCLVGHTHIPLTFAFDKERLRYHVMMPPYTDPLPLANTDMRLILNPGSVGQPRDGDPRASYAILDAEMGTWEHRRVAYPVEVTQERMRDHGLPPRLVNRIQLGR
jgi:diadenosine tetraphosphatase ApaH/serine/threonine PP2A family protein phosphatase